MNETELKAKLGEQIKKLRKKHELAQEALA